MNYNEIKSIAESKNLQIGDLDDQLGLARNGLKRSFERQTLSMFNVAQLCQILGITPNELFSWQVPMAAGGNYASHVTGGNTQNSNEAIKALKDQLKEKDKQIGRLLTLLEKGSEKETITSLAADGPVGYRQKKSKK